MSTMPWWNAPVAIYNLIGFWCPLPRRKCLGALHFQQPSIQGWNRFSYLTYFSNHLRMFVAWFIRMCFCFTEICRPGSVSDTGFFPCTLCERRSYQPNSQQRHCLLCPGSNTTINNGSTSLEQCVCKYMIPFIVVVVLKYVKLCLFVCLFLFI